MSTARPVFDVASTMANAPGRRRRAGLTTVLGDEGFRLFFPLSALYTALWPVMWAVALGFDLPLATATPPALWHANEMLVGAFGAALIGFLTTAVPEWTDTPRLRGRALFALAALWGGARVVGVFGWDGAGVLGALLELGWLAALVAYLLRVSWRQRTERLAAFVFWLLALTAAVGWMRWSFASGAVVDAQTAARLVALAYLGLLGVALARITPPVTNLVLDPSEATSPFRPHPGRRNLAPGLVVVAMAGELAPLSPQVLGYLYIAAGAAFMDRVADGFVGRAFFRAELLMLAGAAAFAGLGLLLLGAVGLGAPWGPAAGLHTALMGGLGLGVFAVFCIAGRLHTGAPLGLSRSVRLAAVLLVGAVALRVLPEFGLLAGATAAAAWASALWAAAFLIWLVAYWPALGNPATCGARRC